jgi:hypothetical protein
MDACPVRGAAGHAASRGGHPQPVLAGVGPADRRDRGGSRRPGRADSRAGAASPSARGGSDPGGPRPPLRPDGTARRLERPQAPAAQTRDDRGKNTCHTLKHVGLINAARTLLWLSDTDAGSTHDTRLAAATPYPVPAGSRWLQDRGVLAFTLDHVEISMPTKQPRGRALTRAQQRATRRIARRRVRIEPVNSRVKRCRIVHDTNRLRKVGVRDLVMAICCAVHTVRVRLIPWHPMI